MDAIINFIGSGGNLGRHYRRRNNHTFTLSRIYLNAINSLALSMLNESIKIRFCFLKGHFIGKDQFSRPLHHVLYKPKNLKR